MYCHPRAEPPDEVFLGSFSPSPADAAANAAHAAAAAAAAAAAVVVDAIGTTAVAAASAAAAGAAAAGAGGSAAVAILPLMSPPYLEVWVDHSLLLKPPASPPPEVRVGESNNTTTLLAVSWKTIYVEALHQEEIWWLFTCSKVQLLLFVVDPGSDGAEPGSAVTTTTTHLATEAPLAVKFDKIRTHSD